MKKSGYAEEQIIGILEQHEAGLKNCGCVPRARDQRGHVLRLESKYDSIDRSDAQRLRQVEEESRCLTQLVADLSLDREVLKSGIRKNGCSLPA